MFLSVKKKKKSVHYGYIRVQEKSAAIYLLVMLEKRSYAIMTAKKAFPAFFQPPKLMPLTKRFCKVLNLNFHYHISVAHTLMFTV